MADTFFGFLASQGFVTLFFVLGFGHLVGRLKLGFFSPGPTAGALLVALTVGSLAFQTIFLSLFTYASASVWDRSLSRACGPPESVTRAVAALGQAVRPTNATDIIMLAFGIATGYAIGLITVPIAGVPIGLGAMGGVVRAISERSRSAIPSVGLSGDLRAQHRRVPGLRVSGDGAFLEGSLFRVQGSGAARHARRTRPRHVEGITVGNHAVRVNPGLRRAGIRPYDRRANLPDRPPSEQSSCTTA